MNRKQNTAIYLRMATPPREQKAWVYASAKEYQRTEPMETAIALLTKSAQKNGYLVAGASRDLERETPPMERPGMQEMLRAMREKQVGMALFLSLAHISQEMPLVMDVLREIHSSGATIYCREFGKDLPEYKNPQKNWNRGVER